MLLIFHGHTECALKYKNGRQSHTPRSAPSDLQGGGGQSRWEVAGKGTEALWKKCLESCISYKIKIVF